MGLIASGNLSGSPLSRFWGLSERLGPVKSPTFRVASRIANSILAAGHPVKDYSELDSCRLILVCVRDAQLPKIVSELVASTITWRGKAVVLCSTWLDSSELDDLSARGAAIGSISPIPGFDETRYLVEGDRLAIRQARSLVEHRGRRAVDIERPLKPFYLAALTCTGTLLFTLLLATSEVLHHAGIPASSSAVILDRLVSKTLRSVNKAGRNAYPPLPDLTRQLKALVSVDPALAHYIKQTASLAAQFKQGLSKG